MIYVIAAAVLLAVIALVALFSYIDFIDRKNDRAETLRFQAMSADERQEALAKAKKERAQALEYRDHMQKLWSGYKWGFKHNPYFARYTVANLEYNKACARVEKLEGIISELDD